MAAAPSTADLLFRQVCLLAAVCGILASREPLPGLVALAALWVLHPPRSHPLPRLVLLLLFFGGGAGYSLLRAPTPPPEPAWVRALTAENPQVIPEGFERSSLPDEREPMPPKPASMRLRAVVESVTPLYGGRLRLLLRDARPAASAVPGTPATARFPHTASPAGALEPGTPRGKKEAPPNGEPSPVYAGKILWTWRNPSLYPLPGQEVEGTLRLSPARGMHNPGTWNAERAWHDGNIRLRAWSNGPGKTGEEVRVEGEVGIMERLRDTLFSRFLAAMPGGGTPSSGNGAQPETLSRTLEHAEYARIFAETGAAMLPALIFGDRSLLSPRQTELVANSTLAHSLSLSGLHLGYTVSLTLGAVIALGFAAPALWERLPRPYLVLPVALLPAALYVWLGQAPISLLRAMFMLLFWALLALMGRPRVMLDGLVAAVALLLLMDPSSLFDLSLQLSALSVAVIALTMPTVSRWSRLVVPASSLCASTARGCLNVLLLSAAIQAALLPLTARAFGTAALCFPLNLVWLPVLGFVVMPLSFIALGCCAAGLSGAAQLFLTLAALPCDGFLHSLAWMDAHGLLPAPVVPRPHWLSTAGFWILGLSLPGFIRILTARPRPGTARGAPLLSPGGRRAAGPVCCGVLLMAAPLLLAAHERYAHGVRLRVLDVAQGQAILLEWRGGRAMIDGGGFASDTFDVGKAIVAPLLTDNASPRISLLVNSHPDLDHLGGLLYLLEHFSVGDYASSGDVPMETLETRRSAALARARIVPKVWKEGEVAFLSPDLSLEVLWPPRRDNAEAKTATRAENGNNRSLVLRLVWRGKPLALLCGDVEENALRDLLKRHGDITAPVLALPHHGSAKSLLPDFYEAVAPKIALVSCGYGNQWGFPAAAVREELLKRGVPLYSTAMRGQILVEWKTPEKAPRVVCSRPAPSGADASPFSGVGKYLLSAFRRGAPP